jgi:hypothetical protein
MANNSEEGQGSQRAVLPVMTTTTTTTTMMMMMKGEGTEQLRFSRNTVLGSVRCATLTEEVPIGMLFVWNLLHLICGLIRCAIETCLEIDTDDE